MFLQTGNQRRPADIKMYTTIRRNLYHDAQKIFEHVV